MPSPAGPVAVAIDASPLLGVRTGVGESVAGFIDAVATDPHVGVVGYALSATAGKLLAERLPGSVTPGRRVPIPAEALLRVWARFDHPTVELWTGPVDVAHGTNFVVPPSRKAARLVTVHDLTPLRFPELCSPTSLRYPALIRRALQQGASIHTVSQAMADDVMEHFQVDVDRVHVIHNGLTPLPLPLARGEAEPPYILAIGTVEPRKGLPDLVAAFDRIAGSVPDVNLKIAGPPGWGEDAVSAGLRSARHAAAHPSHRMDRRQEFPHRGCVGPRLPLSVRGLRIAAPRSNVARGPGGRQHGRRDPRSGRRRGRVGRTA